MSNDDVAAVHYVCTYKDSLPILEAQSEFYLRTCGCRARHPENHADSNCCLWFNAGESSDEFGPAKRITRDAAAAMVEHARETGLIIRPFRDFKNLTDAIGICFCCTCCCSYFNDVGQEACDKGACIEQTDAQLCNVCGLCVDACHFNARILEDDVLQISKGQCYGCGLCADACPTDAIRMVGRTSGASE